MKTFGIAYIATLVSFLAIDAIWLGFVARKFYREQLGDLMLPSPNFAVAAVFYLFSLLQSSRWPFGPGSRRDRFGQQRVTAPFWVLQPTEPTI